MNVERFLRRDLNRKDAYQLLSACYYLPEEDTFGKLVQLEEAMGSDYAQAAEYVTNMREETDIEQLIIDFSRLFVGPFKLLAPPYGSVNLEGGRRIMGNSTLDAHNRYRAWRDPSVSISWSRSTPKRSANRRRASGGMS